MPDKRREVGEASRQRILDAAAKLMAEHGYVATSVSQLAQEAGLPPSSIYWHFSNKESVLQAVMERGAQRFLGAFNDTSNIPGTSSARLHQRIMRIGSSLLENPEHTHFLQLMLMVRLHHQEHQEKAIHDLVAGVRTESVAAVRSWISDVQKDFRDQISEKVASDLAEFAIAMIEGIYLNVKAGGSSAPAVMLTNAANVLVRLAEDGGDGNSSKAAGDGS